MRNDWWVCIKIFPSLKKEKMVLVPNEDYTNHTDPEHDDTPSVSPWIPSNFPPPDVKMGIRLITEVAIDVDVLSELSSVPIQSVQEIVDGTYEQIASGFSPFSHVQILKKTLIGLFRYKYQDKAVIFDMLQKVEEELSSINSNASLDGLAIENIDKTLIKIETFKSLVDLIKTLNITKPLNVDEFRLEHKNTFIFHETALMPFQQPPNLVEESFYDTASIFRCQIFQRAKVFMAEFGVTLFVSQKEKKFKDFKFAL